MASLLDMVVAQRNPRLAGLLGTGGPEGQGVMGQEQAAPSSQPSQGPQGVGRAIQQLFGGPGASVLTPEQNAQIQKQAMIQGGLASFGSDKRGLGRLADAILVGNQLGQSLRSDLVDQEVDLAELQSKLQSDRLDRKLDLQEFAITQKEEQRKTNQIANRQELFANVDLGDPRQRTALMGELIQASDFEGAEILNKFEGKFPEAREVANGDEIILYDPRTLEKKGTIQTPDERPEGTQIVDHGTYSDLIDSDTGETIRRFKNTLTPSEVRKEQEFYMEQLGFAERAVKARNNFNVIEGYLTEKIREGGENPLQGIRFDRARFENTGILVPLAMRHKLDSDTQEFLQAQEAFMIQLAHDLAKSRGVSQESTRKAIYRAFGFEEGDRPENILNTLRELEIGIIGDELRAGEALDAFEDRRVPSQVENPLQSTNQTAGGRASQGSAGVIDELNRLSGGG